MKYLRWGVIALLLIVINGCRTMPSSFAASTAIPTAAPLTAQPSATRIVATPAPTLTATPTDMPPNTPTPLPTDPPAPTLFPVTDPVTPEIINTPLPGDGSLQPIGQHAYSIDLDVVNAQGLTRTATISYLLYLPGGYGQDPAQQWPLVLYLHGSDVWGNNPEDLIASGLPRLLTSTLDFPAIVLSPQVPEDAVWWGTQLDEASALLDRVQATYPVDARRIYLTGPSMGGFGAWALLLRSPQRFAAVAPIAGGWDSERDIVPRNICAIKNVPIWVFHGAQDDIVLPKKAELMVNALKQCGVEVRYTLYPDANHRESFARAYDDPELYAWLFEQHLP